MCIKFSMLCVRQVMNNLTEGQMLFSVIGESILKILESFPVVEKFMSRSLETSLPHLTSTGIVHKNRTDIFLKKGRKVKKKRRKGGRKGWFVFFHIQLVQTDFWGLNCHCHLLCHTASPSLGCSSLSLAGLEPEATMEVDWAILSHTLHMGPVHVHLFLSNRFP